MKVDIKENRSVDAVLPAALPETSVDLGAVRLVMKPAFQGDCLVLACEWFIGDELVRRDAWANVLAAKEMTPEQGAM